jgi:hypothetical protein
VDTSQITSVGQRDIGLKRPPKGPAAVYNARGNPCICKTLSDAHIASFLLRQGFEQGIQKKSHSASCGSFLVVSNNFLPSFDAATRMQASPEE